MAILLSVLCHDSYVNNRKNNAFVQLLSSRECLLQLGWRRGWFCIACAPGMATSAWCLGQKGQKKIQWLFSTLILEWFYHIVSMGEWSS